MSSFNQFAFDTGVFPADYSSARERWLNVLTKYPGHFSHKNYECPGVLGPESQQLLTDTAWLGSEDASKVLILIGGTHGIEGFVGSAIQIDFLNILLTNSIHIPANTAILLLHALTPWGYAWLRRCDQNGVDLNRNFVDFSKDLPDNDGYHELRESFFEGETTQIKFALDQYEKAHGKTELERAISGGQYEDPLGPFYGGKKPAHGRLVVEAVMAAFALQQRDLAVIDLHSGLGSFGYGEVICDHEPDSCGTAVARKWYGESVALPALGTSSSCPKSGLLDYAWHAIMNHKSCYITLEFGTYCTEQLFSILLRDHQLWSKTNNEQTRYEHSKIMRHHFCPDDQAWREMVLFRGRQVIAQALRGLAS